MTIFREAVTQGFCELPNRKPRRDQDIVISMRDSHQCGDKRPWSSKGLCMMGGKDSAMIR